MSYFSKFFIVIFCGSFAMAGLPRWAKDRIEQSHLTPVDKEEYVVALYDNTIIYYKGDGVIQRVRQVIYRVDDERGAIRASIYTINGNQDTTKVKRLKGWHQNPKRKVENLDKNNVLTVGAWDINELNKDLNTLAFFSNVEKGSYVVFESKEVEVLGNRNSFDLAILSTIPCSTKQFLVDTKGWFLEKNISINIKSNEISPWRIEASQSDQSYTFKDLPGIGKELYIPEVANQYPYPYISVDIVDPNYFAIDYKTWEEMGIWYSKLFKKHAQTVVENPSKPVDILKSIEDVVQRIGYRQVYLDTSRNISPIKGFDVYKIAYGDCKDMVSALAYKCGLDGFNVLPVMVSIARDHPPLPTDEVKFVFNHLIGAVELTKPMGYDSEFSINGKRWLLVDPTIKTTSLGKLPAHYAGIHVLVCAEEGSFWLKIEDSMVEQQRIEFILDGNCGSEYTFRGKLTIKETGNAFGLRSIYTNGSIRDIKRSIRSYLDWLPDVKDSDFKIDVHPDGSVTYQCQVIWPELFVRNGFGMRLDWSIVPDRRRVYRSLIKPRISPIYFDQSSELVWQLNIKGLDNLVFQDSENFFTNEIGLFSWKLNLDQMFSYTFKQQIFGKKYQMSEKEKGVEQWKKFEKAYDDYCLEMATFKLK